MPLKWQPILFILTLGMCALPWLLKATLTGKFNYGIRDFLIFISLYLFGCLVIYLSLIWLPKASLCQKVAFSSSGIYVINGLNKFVRRPLHIPYKNIKKICYVPWNRIYLVYYINKSGKIDTYATAFTKENIERLRERLRALQEEGKWSGKLEIVRLVPLGLRGIPEDELTVPEGTKNRR